MSRYPTGRGWASMSTKAACGGFGAISCSGTWHRARCVADHMKHANLGIAVVGAGRIGTLRARLSAKHPSVRFLAISDRDPARARALAGEAGANMHSGSNDEVIA